MKKQVAALVMTGWALTGVQPLRADDTVELTTRVSGVVETVRVKPGQRVKKGTVLLQLGRTVLQARLDEAAAEEMLAQADEANAKRDLDRAQELFDRTVSSASEMEAATLRYARAQSARKVAEARRVIAQKNLQDAELKAPFDGVVKAIPGAPGTVVVADCQPRPLVVISR